MSADIEQRKLAAIMFTDMVGYSALSQRDDKLALELLEEHRQLLREIFPRFNGTEIKTIGDAFLVEFNSALEAAQCAIEIQRALAKRNHDVIAERRIEVKIGIHIGDVVHRGGDVYGDGVNVASRIESLAGAGGICVSMDVERQIRNAVETRFEKLATTELKNISVPMELFRIVLPWEKQLPRPESKSLALPPRARTWIWAAAAAAAALLLMIGIGWWWSTRKPLPEQGPSVSGALNQPANIPEKSIAVLPFENLSSDKENAYFAEGIQDEILTRLSKIGALKVISRTSTQKYKSAPDNLRDVGKQLGVANLLEGSVQKAANAVHVNVQLIRAATDDHLWAESYDRKLDDIFGVEKEVAQNIAAALNAKLSGAEEQAIAQKPTANQTAYEAYLRGNTQFWEVNEQSLLAAENSYREAVKADSQFALAWAALARLHAVLFLIDDTTPTRRAAAEQAVNEAERLQPEAAETKVARGYFAYLVQYDFKGTLDLMEQAHRTWPNNAEVLQLLAFAAGRLGEWNKAADAFDQALLLSPRDLVTRRWAINNRLDSRDFMTARRLSDEALQIWPGDPNLLGLKAETFQAFGQLDEAQALVSRMKPRLKDYDAVSALWYQAKLRRDPAPAIKILEPLARPTESGFDWLFNAAELADLQALAGDNASSRATFRQVRDRASALTREQPDNQRYLGTFAQALAHLGQREQALGVLDKMLELRAGDLRNRPTSEEERARILTLFGEKDQAIPILQRLLQTRYSGWATTPLTPALLRLDPDFDPLRGDPRFQKLCEEKPK